MNCPHCGNVATAVWPRGKAKPRYVCFRCHEVIRELTAKEIKKETGK